jgi:hypothetical protein
MVHAALIHGRVLIGLNLCQESKKDYCSSCCPPPSLRCLGVGCPCVSYPAVHRGPGGITAGVVRRGRGAHRLRRLPQHGPHAPHHAREVSSTGRGEGSRWLRSQAVPHPFADWQADQVAAGGKRKSDPQCSCRRGVTVGWVRRATGMGWPRCERVQRSCGTPSRRQKRRRLSSRSDPSRRNSSNQPDFPVGLLVLAVPRARRLSRRFCSGNQSTCSINGAQ